MAGRGRGGRGPTPMRGGPVIRGAGRGGRGGVPVASNIASHITTIGVRRPNFGSAGRPMNIKVNAFEAELPSSIIYHYDVVIKPDEKVMPARFNLDIIRRLQDEVAPHIFPPDCKAVYDGRKNLFSPRALPFPQDQGDNTDSYTFDIPAQNQRPDKPPKIFRVTLKRVAEVNPETLHRFIQGKQSHDNSVLTALTALNVVIRMEPTLKFPANVRSFFTEMETKYVGSGVEVWRGYFQSVRPTIGKAIINIDISTGAMYKKGPLIGLCLDFLHSRDTASLVPVHHPKERGLSDRESLKLQRFIAGMRVATTVYLPGSNTAKTVTRVFRSFTREPATRMMVKTESGDISVYNYYAQRGRKLKHPEIVCAEVGAGSIMPLEFCEVPKGQLMRKQVPPECTASVLEFATMRPANRLQSIVQGLNVLAYGQSQYVRTFGMSVISTDAMRVGARVLTPPTLQYGVGSRQREIKPANGAWNMVDKKFYVPCSITAWAIAIFDKRFQDARLENVIRGFVEACTGVGIHIDRSKCFTQRLDGQGRIGSQLYQLGMDCKQRVSTPPSLIVAILPEGGNDIYTAVKHFGDITKGVATQCLKGTKCAAAKPQYWANVCLKVNGKLGGINTIPLPSAVSALTDPHNPTIVFGADVVHPAPGSQGRPSFAALVGNVDTANAKYIARCGVQESRNEMIQDLGPMAEDILKRYISYRQQVEKRPAGASLKPKRIIFYRDGVSEGQFAQVLEQELPPLQQACKNLGIDAKITMIVVGKRHHVRFFPISEREADRSGNCPAGTVVDSDVAHPTEFDFYLQSHGGLLGTSRPSHYSVLYDENKFNADELQSLSFALCHVYARSTRSVSIPAPVYYADIVCSRAKIHYDPEENMKLDESGTPTGDSAILQTFREGFKQVNARIATTMYFS